MTLEAEPGRRDFDREEELDPADASSPRTEPDAALSGGIFPASDSHGTPPEAYWAPPEPVYSAASSNGYEPQALVPAALPRLIPHLGHTALFFLLALVTMAVGEVIGVLLLEQTHLLGRHSFQDLSRMSAGDARLTLPIQALSYALVAVVVIPIFGLLWHEPFGEGIHWNAAAARRNAFRLALAGLALGFGIGAFGNFLPMPKDPPIMHDIMKSTLGAWLMLAFGVTAAPLLEELAFRGFLLPSLINFFRWLSRKSVMPETAVRWIGVPLSILITSLGFAYMHSPQVSHAWGPLVLIGSVSVVLCIVRLAMNSVAAGVIVHAAYNLTLFGGMLAQTGGFRHLDRLTT
jgi:uncharacterized protein